MIRFFASHPTAANLLMIVMLAAGLLTLPLLQKATFPEFDVEAVSVSVAYPGAAAVEVEEAVCQRLEDALDQVTGIDELRCTAQEGAGVAVAEMRPGEDLVGFAADIRTEVEAIDDFPDLVEAPIIRVLNITDPVVTIAIAGPFSETDLELYAEQTADRLIRTTDVSQATVSGFSQREFRVAVDPVRARELGLSVAAVADAIAGQNLTLPTGSVETTEREVLVRLADERRSPEALEDLVIRGTASGGTVRLGAIAEITDAYADNDARVFLNGRQAALIEVAKTADQDTLEIMAATEAFVAEAAARAAPGVEYRLTRDVASIVEDRLTMLVGNGLAGLGLVFFVLWLFFGLRTAFWVAAGLPVAFMATLFALVVIGYSINMMTMVALLIAIGLMMDDAIVISENISRHLEEGASSLRAAIDGVMEVRAGVLSSFATSICVFGPLAVLDGTIGKVLQVVPVVLIVTLAASIVEAFLILPHHLTHGRSGHARGRFHAGFDRAFDRLRTGFIEHAVTRAVAWRYLFLGIVAMAFLIALALVAGGTVKFKAFPDLDGDVAEARILLPEGTPLARTEAVVALVTEGLEAAAARFADEQPTGADGSPQPLVQAVLVKYGQNADVTGSGPHMATVTVDLLPAEQRNTALDPFFAAWREAVGRPADVASLTFTQPQMGPAGLPLDIRLTGVDLAELDAAAEELKTWLGGYDGVADMADDLRPGKPEIAVTLTEAGTSLGLTSAMVADQLRAALYGTTAADLQRGPQNIEVTVSLAGVGRDSLGALDRMSILLPDGGQVPLASVATLETSRGVSSIRRIEGQRTVTVTGDVDPERANVNEILADTQARFLPELQARYPGLEVALEGEAASSAETGASLQRGFLLGLIGIFVLLSFQFRSYIEPLIVMTAIPMALIGVVAGHLIMGLDLSMPSVLGFVSLAGVVVNDSILLVTFVKRRAAEGDGDITNAAIRAARDRFRPVLLTSLTTVAGLLPLLFEGSLQAQVLIPLVASLAFGLIASTVLVLMFVPAFYAVLHDFGVTTTARDTARAGEDHGETGDPGGAGARTAPAVPAAAGE